MAENGDCRPIFSGDYDVTFGIDQSARVMRGDESDLCADQPFDRLAMKAQRLHDLVKQRETCFRQSVMADSNMGVMLSLFLAELKSVPLTEATLLLVNLIEGDEARRVVDSLIHAGLVVVTGANPDRRTVGLTPLGSARMRSFISDYPDF
jgi:hypothetical protein